MLKAEMVQKLGYYIKVLDPEGMYSKYLGLMGSIYIQRGSKKLKEYGPEGSILDLFFQDKTLTIKVLSSCYVCSSFLLPTSKGSYVV